MIVDKKKTVNELPGTPSLYKEVLRSDWDKAQATIEQQAREIERLRAITSVTCGVGDGSGKLFVHGDYDSIKRVQGLIFEVEALRKKSGVVLPKRSNERGSDGNLTYEAVAHNRCLDEVAHLNSSPVSAETAHVINCTVENYCKDGVMFSSQAGDDRAECVADGLSVGMSQDEAEEFADKVAVSAGGVDERADVHMLRVRGTSFWRDADKAAFDSAPDDRYEKLTLYTRAALTASAPVAPDAEWALHLLSDRWPESSERVEVEVFADWLRDLLASTASAQSVPAQEATFEGLSDEAKSTVRGMVEYCLNARVCMGMDEGFKSFDPDIEHDFVIELHKFAAAPAPGKGGAE